MLQRSRFGKSPPPLLAAQIIKVAVLQASMRGLLALQFRGARPTGSQLVPDVETWPILRLHRLCQTVDRTSHTSDRVIVI